MRILELKPENRSVKQDLKKKILSSRKKKSANILTSCLTLFINKYTILKNIIFRKSILSYISWLYFALFEKKTRNNISLNRDLQFVTFQT